LTAAGLPLEDTGKVASQEPGERVLVDS
jgi:hypothetical protein